MIDFTKKHGQDPTDLFMDEEAFWAVCMATTEELGGDPKLAEKIFIEGPANVFCRERTMLGMTVHWHVEELKVA